MAVPKTTLYFDICSPFSWIAFHVLTLTSASKKSPVFSTCDVDFVPVSLRGLFQKSGNSPPIASKNKFQWINRERLYWARRFNVPMSEAIPEGFPAPTAEIQTVLSILAKEAPEQVVAVVQSLYSEYWGKANSKVLNPEGFSVILEQELGSELAERVLAQANGDEGKSALEETTQKAFGSGAFGLPWFNCTRPNGETEGFWGIDHLGRLVDFLHLNRSLDNSFEVLL
ncbi:unnamed protein product [Penicillium bialowiezense]